ncbi:uncharacterized protein STEHIDRAFT_119272 [Stereum hirsutum FP-91666 SS1]|uniref:uncharacterized protein n=1 Tax=Stereum hirsutum (strain FP-91666) TaxID=721885 RepID=UPI000440BADD|nr:uncharacterized protein STEHIDRAFT_119272 [Stereum hirsutum FP-91666 SS1]EIM90230.1 hypothetical protein STEHIDRAFT_119272 [Stereum hirsutum FP-91666 SS1]
MVGNREHDWMRETALELGEPEEEEYDVYDYWPSLQIVVAAREDAASSYEPSQPDTAYDEQVKELEPLPLSLVTFENIVDYRFDSASKPGEGGQDEEAQAASVVATPGYSPLFRLGLLFTIASANGLRERMTKMRRRLERVLRKCRARILGSRAS